MHDAPSDEELLRRIQEGGPEGLAAMLLGAGQRNLAQAIEALGQQDAAEAARTVGRVADIVLELRTQLDLEGGGEVAGNLAAIYDGWVASAFQGLQNRDAGLLERISEQMGEFRETWEQVVQRRAAGA